MKVIYFITLFTVALYVWLSSLALRRWPKSKTIRRFAILLLVVALWVFLSIFQVVYSQPGNTNILLQDILARFDYALAAIISFFFMSFSLHFPRENKSFHIREELLASIPTVVITILSLFGVFFKYHLVQGTVGFTSTPWYWFYIVVVITNFLGIGLLVLIRKLRSTSGVIHLQLKYLVTGYSISIVILLAMSVINAIHDIDNTIDLWLTNASLLFITTSSYSVFKHRLLGFRTLIKKSAIITVSYFLLFFLYTYLIIWLRDTSRFPSFSETDTTIIAVLVIVLSYPILRRWMHKLIDMLFAPSDIARRERLLSKVIHSSGQMSYMNLFPQLEKEIKKKIPLDGIYGAVLEVSGEYFEQYPEKHFEKTLFTRSHPLVRLLKEKEPILVRDEIPFLLEELPLDKQTEFNEAKTLLEQLQEAVAVLIGSTEVGPVILFLPKKKDKTAYGSEEIEFLKQLAYEASPAFENIFLYQQALKRAGVPIS